MFTHYEKHRCKIDTNRCFPIRSSCRCSEDWQRRCPATIMPNPAHRAQIDASTEQLMDKVMA
jgi:hypothetical protein